MSHTTTDLINNIKRRTAIPISQATFTEADIVDYLNDELESIIAPMVMNLREEFFVTYTDFAISNGTIAFDIPSNAIGQRLRDVMLVDISGNSVQFTNIPRLSFEQISAVSVRGSSAGNLNLWGFYLEGNQVKLYPTTGWDNETLRLYYFKKPGTLVPVDQTGKITAIDTGTSILSLDSVPSSWLTSTIVDGICPT